MTGTVGAPGAPPPVVLVAGTFGRTGSTALMALLGTSDEVAFERAYPFETRCWLPLLHQALQLDGAARARADALAAHQLALDVPCGPGAAWRRQLGRALGLIERRWVSSRGWEPPGERGWRVAPPAWVGRGGSLLSADDGRWWDHLAAAWAVHGTRLAATWSDRMGVGPRWYAEKVSAWEAEVVAGRPGIRTLLRVRDPRDTWLSIQGYDRPRGSRGFGRRAGESDERFLRRFLAMQHRSLVRVAELEGAEDPLVVRFEDMVGDPEGVAERFGRSLGVDLDVDGLAATTADIFDRHATSATPATAVGRWRGELPAELADRFRRELGDVLEAVGYAP